MTFLEFLRQRLETGGFSTEDTLASVLPLFRQVALAHGEGRVAPLDDPAALSVEGTQIWFEESRTKPPSVNRAALRRFEREPPRAVEITDEARVTLDVDIGFEQFVDLAIGERDAELTRPVYLPGYVCWEHAVGHHDPLTDVFSLGLILASLACGLDLTEPEQLEAFVKHRRNPFELNRDLHPVLARMIGRMTELDRHRRPQDLAAVVRVLENYRDQDVDFDLELARIADFERRDRMGKQQIILGRLQERLFEISRRNRLLHFRPTMHSVNLTHASVPLSFDVRNIRPDQILTWNAALQREIVSGKPLSLNRYLNFKEAVYLPSVLDAIRLNASRDQKEFGFAQLRLVLCFLRWANLKVTPAEEYDSPLVLLPVELVKKKGIRDTWSLKPLDTRAEVNPVVRHLFAQLYGIELPESIDLEEAGLDELHAALAARIQASEPAVSLECIDRPRIQLIHEKARRRLDQYRRRARLAGRGVRTFFEVDYSYDPANYHPLGLKLFTSRIRPAVLHLNAVLETRPRPRPRAVAEPAKAVEQERVLYQLRERGESNPYTWEFDLCSVTLGNFRYRKMSLVRDYTALLNNGFASPAFEATFSLSARPVDDGRPAALPLGERFQVVACDPTQTAAIAEARTGRSYIIQGPPGTGKSQTITNLIGDAVAQGRRVLFVCEKRAAIDVVYHRLKQQGLDRLCCLIHDSQTDKREFVADLKRTYEGFLETPLADGEDAVRERGTLVESIERELAPLERFDAAMRSSPPPVGCVLRRLLGRLVELRERLPEFTPALAERVPRYADWLAHGERLERFFETLRDVLGPPDKTGTGTAGNASNAGLRERSGEPVPVLSGGMQEGVLARSPWRLLRAEVAGVERPLEFVGGCVRECVRLLGEITSGLERLRLLPAVRAESRSRLPGGTERASDAVRTSGPARQAGPTGESGLEQVRDLLEYGRAAEFLGRRKLMDVLQADSETAREFKRAWGRYRKRVKALAEARKTAAGWTTKLPRDEVAIAREQAERLERTTLAFLQPAWWRLRSVLRRCYDFRRHAIKPTWTRILGWLADEYQAEAACETVRAELRRRYALDGDPEDFQKQTSALSKRLKSAPPHVQQVHAELRETGRADESVVALAGLHGVFEQMRRELDRFLTGWSELSLADLETSLAGIEAGLGSLPDFLPCLKELAALPEGVVEALRTLPLDRQELESSSARRSLDEVYRADRSLARFTGADRDRHARALDGLLGRWQTANARHVFEGVRRKFVENVRISTLPAAQLTSEQKEFKKQYNRGRRELEHEFGKSMRYKPIRELVSGDSGLVVKDLKPVWLMSPLSVSDTLPLETGYFDVVIFDEASQITLEEAIPSLFRAPQTIVVGDEMQLPPTNFFSAKRDGDDEPLEFEHDGEQVQYDLEGDSFLNHAARNLPSRMLGWHYRSRSESLISFSNRAFYSGRLLTVPDERLAPPGRPELIAREAADGERHLAELLARAVSFHFLEHGVYEQRRNRAEAEYIAHLVRGLLRDEGGPTVGIVAFSEAQQGEIEAALDRLAGDDPPFAARLEAEREREIDNQFAGLLVKNLENIQGDERDIVILSVCYAHGPDGRMRMNFGPINQSGGERRLNVAFSRAKHHMAVVSSIRSTAITNDYNDGANCLKNYLRYAEACSAGDGETASRILRSLSPRPEDDERAPGPRRDAVVARLAEALNEHGWLVDLGVGQSHFRCDLAIRHDGDREYRLGILVDTEAWYAQTDLLERELMKPRLLEAFGWKVTVVLARDWCEAAGDVLVRIEREAAGS